MTYLGGEGAMTHDGRRMATAPRAAGTLAAAGMAALAGRYARARAAADRDWQGRVESRLSDIGEVDEVTMLPLVERLTLGDPLHSRLRGEAGVSYLVKAGDTTLCSTPA